MKKTLLTVSLCSLLLSPAQANDTSTKAVEEVIEKHELESQEFKPIIYDEKPIERSLDKAKVLEDESPIKKISFKNEFFQSVKLLLKSAEDEKVLYLNPYEKLADVVIDTQKNYIVKVFDFQDNYLGNLIRANMATKSLIQVSPFLVFPDLVKKDSPMQKETKVETITITKNTSFTKEKITTKKETSEEAKQETKLVRLTEMPKPIEAKSLKSKDAKKKIEDLKAEVKKKVIDEQVGNLFKIANISDYKIKVSIVKASGENIGTNWTIENDVYSPETLNFASKPVKLEPDTKVKIVYLDSDDKKQKEVEILAKDIKKDHHNNYTYFVHN